MPRSPVRLQEIKWNKAPSKADFLQTLKRRRLLLAKVAIPPAKHGRFLHPAIKIKSLRIKGQKYKISGLKVSKSKVGLRGVKHVVKASRRRPS